VSAAQAESRALQAVSGASVLTAPRLVSLEGAIAYEVGLDQGPVYIDATTGNVLYNGTTAATSTGTSGTKQFAGGDDEEYEEHDAFRERNEHEEYDDEDD
jgi:hypothetical protein